MERNAHSKTIVRPVCLTMVFITGTLAVLFGLLSVWNGSTHALDLARGDRLAAIFFALPIPMIGLVFEAFAAQAGPKTQHIYNVFIRTLALYGGVGFVCGLTFVYSDPFPELFIDWRSVAFTSQVALEISFIHACWHWIKQLRKQSQSTATNPYWQAKQTEKEHLITRREEERDFQSQLQTERKALLFKAARAGRLSQILKLEARKRELEDFADNARAERNIILFKNARAGRVSTIQQLQKERDEQLNSIAQMEAEKRALLDRKERADKFRNTLTSLQSA